MKKLTIIIGLIVLYLLVKIKFIHTVKKVDPYGYIETNPQEGLTYVTSVPEKLHFGCEWLLDKPDANLSPKILAIKKECIRKMGL